jgi:hypothetical protein
MVANTLQTLNNQLFQQLSKTPQGVEMAVDAINSFTRYKMREVGIMTMILEGPSIRWMIGYMRWLAGERYAYETAREYWKARNRIVRQIRSGRRVVNNDNIETVQRTINLIFGALEEIERTYGFGMEVARAHQDDRVHA